MRQVAAGMTVSSALALHPRWDGRRVLFEVTDQGRTTPCAISLNALQDLSERRLFKPADLLKCFAAVQERLEAIAVRKLRLRPESASGLLNIWSDDIEDSALAEAAVAP